VVEGQEEALRREGHGIYTHHSASMGESGGLSM
jgi:hypothetical protein